MASIIYNSSITDTINHAITFDVDSFKFMLVGAGYVPDALAHFRRSDITHEVVGAGYVADGLPTIATVVTDLANARVDVSFGAVEWTNSTIDARGGVLYKARGASPADDELVAYVDFGVSRKTNNGLFRVTFSSPYRYQM